MALTPVEDGYVALAAALYGDGAWEIVKAKTLSEREKRERTQARVGLASNVVGLGAGLAATPGAIAAVRPAVRSARGLPAHSPVSTNKAKLLRPVARSKAVRATLKTLKKPKVAAGLIIGNAALQVANVGGDAVANRVLSRSANAGQPKKKKPVAKGLFDRKKPKLEDQPKAKLVRVGVAAGAAASAAATEQAKKELKGKVGKSVDFTIKGEISKSNDKRQVFGWASVVELNGEPIVDLQGDYMAIDVIEKAAYDYVHSSRRGGDMHAVGSHASDLIESFIVTPEKKAQLNLPDDMPVGWWVGFQVNDDKVWEMVKDGKRPEFSIHGSGQRVDVEI